MPTSRLPLLAAALLVLLLAPAAQAQADGATVRLTLSVGTTGQRVEGAGVRLAAMGADETLLTQTSDALGHVVFEDVPVGFYRVDVLPLGYAEEAFTVVVPAGGEVRKELSLLMAHPLPEVTVEGERILPLLARRGFYGRRDAGFGRFIGREQIDSWGPPARVADLFLRIPQIRVEETFGGTTLVNTASLGTTTLCTFDVFADGVRVNTPEGRHDLDILRADDVLAVEVYARAHQAPQLYRGAGCGTILIWTGNPDE